MDFLKIMVIFLCLNTAWGITAIEGQPTYLEDGWQCFYDPTNVNLDPTHDGTASQIDAVKDEMTFPTNSTVTDTLFGDGTPFNSISETLEASGKAIETMKNFASTSYLTDSLDNIMIDCQLDTVQTFQTQSECEAHNYTWCDDTNVIPSYPATNPNYQGQYNKTNVVWDYITDAMGIMFAISAIVTMYYWITGRGHSGWV